MLRLLCLSLVAASLAGCAGPPRVAAPVPETTPTLVLVSLDGFRWDYLDRPGVQAPTLRWIAEGVRAGRLVPVFPTKTFPNHYSLVTGLHPEAHGIVGNSMRDPGRLVDGQPARFSLSDRDALADSRWWGGEPIWVTAERQGVPTGTVFWPGSEAEIGGVRPGRWLPYDGEMPYAARVDTALAWLDAPDPPRLVTLYVEAVDDAGHRYGPDAPEVGAAIARVDSALARLVDGLRQRGRLDQTSLVVVSDHGMTALSPSRVVLLDDALDLAVDDVDWGEPVGVWPGPGARRRRHRRPDLGAPAPDGLPQRGSAGAAALLGQRAHPARRGPGRRRLDGVVAQLRRAQPGPALGRHARLRQPLPVHARDLPRARTGVPVGRPSGLAPGRRRVRRRGPGAGPRPGAQRRRPGRGRPGAALGPVTLGETRSRATA